jgi:hypothetical protein
MERLNARMSGFMTRRDNLALVIQCGPNEAAAVLRAIQGVDESSGSDFFHVFAEAFTDPASYVQTVVSSFAKEHDRTRKAMPEAGLVPWPEVPAPIKDARRPPLDRMKDLMVFARSLLPAGGGGLLGWALLPLTIADTAGWASFCVALLKHDWPYPWCRGMRIYLRDLVDPPALTMATLEAPRVDHCLVDLGPKIVEEGFKEDAADPELPLEYRYNCVLILAGMDQSHQRYDAAMEKYECVFRGATNIYNPVLATAALNGMGEVNEKKGEDDKAARCYAAALESSAASPVPTNPAVFIATLNCANLALRKEQWADAEQYYGLAEHMAAIQSDPRTRVSCMENRGVAIYMQQRVPEAFKVWDSAEYSAVAGNNHDLAESVLRKELEHYRLIKDEQGIASTQLRIAQVQRRDPLPSTNGSSNGAGSSA